MPEITLNDLFSHKHNPYPFYAQLRARKPLSRWSWKGSEMWLATTYEDIMEILRNTHITMDQQILASSADGQHASSEAILRYVPLARSRHLLNTDPPDHTRLRTLVSRAFTPRMIEQLRPRIQQITDELLDAVQDQEQMDLIVDFAFPLPIIVILEMLGIPTTARQQFREWTQIIIQSQSAVLNPETQAAAITAEEAFISYIKTLLASKRTHPDNDLTSSLLQAEENGDMLTEDELISVILLLIIAGHETTVNLISNGMLALFEHPEQMDRLRDDPSLLPSAIEELLRYTSPVSLSSPRWALEDITIHGQVIRKGEMVRCALLAANTDPQQFPDPDVLDILRQEHQHLAFGKGIHFCLGAPLARLEGQIAIGTLLSRLPQLRLTQDPEQLAWNETGSLRALVSLPVAL